MDVLDPFDYENVDLIRKTIERYRESYQKYEPVCERKCVFKPMIVASESRAGRATQTLYLVQRQLIRMIRDPLVLKAKLAESLFIAFWYGLMYWRSENPYTVTDYQYSWGQIKDINVRNEANFILFFIYYRAPYPCFFSYFRRYCAFFLLILIRLIWPKK